MNTQSDASGRFAILNRIAPLLLRLALGVTLLSAVADRFGIWGPPGAATVAWGDWTHFVAYTAKVNSFLPSALAPALAIVATAAEALLGITLILRSLRWRDDRIVWCKGAAQLLGLRRFRRCISSGRMAGVAKTHTKRCPAVRARAYFERRVTGPCSPPPRPSRITDHPSFLSPHPSHHQRSGTNS